MTPSALLISLIVLLYLDYACLLDISYSGVSVNRLTQISTVNQYMDICLDGIYHKKKPGEEKFLHNECSRYQKRACCHANTTVSMYASSRWHGLNYDHCPPEKMSSKCRDMFMKELCFYECSPNLGPWLVQVDQKLRRERPYGVPLCETQCDTWWQACKLEYTCVRNWGNSFLWPNGINECPANATCETFEKKFGSSANFCHKIWDGSWLPVPDNHPCFRFDFDPTSGMNPNDVVAMYKANQILTAGSDRMVSVSFVLLVSVSLHFVFLNR